MEQFFLIVLVFLFLLAVFDLFVGVSNDAVNFLNSAVGSRIAPFRIILVVASLGVLFGSTFSSGMMEIARSGVFNPSMFAFDEILVIFFAVVMTDVLLFDLYNSIGFTTSTTVSIIFELLGGAVAAAAYKIAKNPDLMVTISDHINSSKAFTIISAIWISVIVAFLAGLIVQYITRLIFTFKYEKIYRYAGSVFGGIAITAILYFLVMKGAKGASFMKPEYIDWINSNTFAILLYSFVTITIIFQLLISFFKVNIFKIIILSGTFALAFAFAGNDLVNFIGVPLAALDAFKTYQASDIAPSLLTMESLQGAVQTPTLYLLIAGALMVATLFFSKKAHNVIQTTLNLSTSSRGAKEQFGSTMLGRTLVRASYRFGKYLNQVVPASVFETIDKRMEKPTRVRGEIALPFDHVRASINLVVASILIASATSMKLPLSTSFVTFMVAMGSSLADGAWDRESAVYRISGVLAIVGGWFLTAAVAFTATALVTTLIFYGGNITVFVLMGLVTIIVIKSNFFGKKKITDDLKAKGNLDRAEICRNVNGVTVYLATAIDLYKRFMNDFLNENLKDLKSEKNEAVVFQEEIAKRRGEYYQLAMDGSGEKIDREARYYYYRVFTNMKEIGHGLRSITGIAYNHVNNSHSVFKGVLRENLKKMVDDLEDLRFFLENYTRTANNSDALNQRSEQSIQFLNQCQHELLSRIDSEDISLRNAELYLSFLQFSRQTINYSTLITLLRLELNERCNT